MLLIFNTLALGFFFIGFVVGCAYDLLGGKGLTDFVLGSIAMGCSDLVFRGVALRSAGWKSLLLPSRGGHVMFLPVWTWGIFFAWLFWASPTK
jgi:hypothetical protein